MPRETPAHEFAVQALSVREPHVGYKPAISIRVAHAHVYRLAERKRARELTRLMTEWLTKFRAVDSMESHTDCATSAEYVAISDPYHASRKGLRSCTRECNEDVPWHRDRSD